MAIAFRCPSCGKELRAKEEYAGKKSKCSACGQVVSIPAAGEPSAPIPEPPAPPATPTTPPPTPPASVGRPSPPSPGGGDTSFLNFLDEELKDSHNVPVEADTRRCPGCGKAVPISAILCVHCGYHFEKGKQLKTIREGPEESPFQAPQSGGPQKGSKRRSKPRSSSSRRGGSSEEDLTGFDIFLCVCCGNIACIVGLVRLIQGDPRGGKMLGLAITIQIVEGVIWGIIQAVLVSGTQ